MEFTLLQEARILYGAGKVQETGALLRRLGVDKALVVCDEGVKKGGYCGARNKQPDTGTGGVRTF